MICAYDRLYLDKARISMGRMLDFAVHELKYNIELFFRCLSNPGLQDGSNGGTLQQSRESPVWKLPMMS